MQNYAIEWKDFVGFKQYSYDDFVTKYADISNAYFLEKIDGFLSPFIYNSNGKSYFQSTTGREITDIPAIAQYEERLKKLKVKSAVLMGELVAQKFGTILPFNQTQSIVKRSYVDENKFLIHHYLYDILYLDGKKVPFPQAVNFIWHYFRPEQSHIHVPEIQKGELNVFREFFAEAIKRAGREGIVVRFANGKAIKVKDMNTFDVGVLGAGHMNLPAWKKNQISYLITSFMDRDGLFRLTSKIGSGYTESQRSELFKNIQKVSLYQDNGDFYIPPKLVIEVKSYRLFQTQVPCYEYKKGKYIFVGKRKGVMLSQPSFLRFRPDKSVNKNDLRIEQVPEFMY